LSEILEKLLEIKKEYLINEIFGFLIKKGGFNYDFNQAEELKNKLNYPEDNWTKFLQMTEIEINGKITNDDYILREYPTFLQKQLESQIEKKMENEIFYFRLYKFLCMLMKFENEKNGDYIVTMFFIFFVMFYEREKEISTISLLYKNIKAIFINSDELIDFPLVDNKPDNLYYVGGFYLDNKLIKKVKILNCFFSLKFIFIQL